MDEWNPRRLWTQVREAFRDLMDEEDEEPVRDPSLMFHLTFSAPLFIALLLTVQLLIQGLR